MKDFNGIFVEISVSYVPQSLRDTIKHRNPVMNVKRNRIVVFENVLSKEKFVFNYYSRDTYFYFTCDSMWKVIMENGHLGTIY